jgi:hypothetical protein
MLEFVHDIYIMNPIKEIILNLRITFILDEYGHISFNSESFYA